MEPFRQEGSSMAPWSTFIFKCTWMSVPRVCQLNIAQSITLLLSACFLHKVHPAAISSPSKWRTHTHPSKWFKRRHDSSDQATFFHCSIVQFWRSCAHSRHFSGAHHGYFDLQCTVCSDTFLSWPALSLSAVWATVALLCDRTRQTSLCFQCASMSLRPMTQISSFKFYLSHTRLYRDCITSSEMWIRSAPWTVQIL